MTDADSIARSLDEPAAFDAIFVAHAPAIFAFTAARVGPHAAEDVTASTFATAFASRARFDTAYASAKPWLYGIAANELRRHAHLERLWFERLQRGGADGDDDGELESAVARADAAHQAEALAHALVQLTPAERDVLLLHVFAELTHAQIAGALGIRRGTAKTRLSRGCARLRTVLDSELTGATDAARP